MAERIRGSFPGGPGKRVEAPTREKPPRLQKVEEIEHRVAARGLHLERRARRHRLATGLVASVALAGILGLYFGLQSQAAAVDVRDEAEVGRPREDVVESSEEASRALPELGKPDGAESARSATSNP